MTHLQPVNQRVLIKITPRSNIRESGIYLPFEHRYRAVEGIVVKRSNDCIEAIDLDDRVIFPQESGVELKIDDEKFLLIHEDEILGVATVGVTLDL